MVTKGMFSHTLFRVAYEDNEGPSRGWKQRDKYKTMIWGPPPREQNQGMIMNISLPLEISAQLQELDCLASHVLSTF